MEVFDGVSKISVCTGFMDSVQIDYTDIDIPKHRNERRSLMKENQNNSKNNQNNSNENLKNRSENNRSNEISKNRSENNRSNDKQSLNKKDKNKNF